MLLLSVAALIAICGWVNGDNASFILMSAYAILIFRAELSLLCGLMLVMELVNRRIDLLSLFLWGAIGAVTGLGMYNLQNCVDSFLMCSITDDCHISQE